MQLEVKTILNAIQHFAGFVYQDIRLRALGRPALRTRDHRGAARRRWPANAPGAASPRRVMTGCRAPAWLFVPLWGIVTWFLYAPRRVECPEHGVVVEHIPWSDGKRPVTTSHDGLSGPLGAAAVVARDGPGLPDQLGMRVSLGGVVCAVGPGASAAGRRSSPSAWTRFTGAKASGRTIS